MKTGHIFVISGPAGVGKTTVRKNLQKTKKLDKIVTYTTRHKRPGEIHKKDYHFVDEISFQKMIDQQKLVEWEKIHGNLYGMTKNSLQKALAEGKNILLVLGLKGAKRVKKLFPDAVMIYIKPEKTEQLRKRLMKRPGTTQQELELRLKNALKEINQKKKYDYTIINKENKLKETLTAIRKVMAKHNVYL